MSASSILRMLRPPRSAVWLVVGLLGGFSAGVFVALRWIAPAQSWMAAVGQGFMLTQMSFSQYEEADYPAAREALEDYLSYLEASRPRDERWKLDQHPMLSARELAWDKALTAGRLALLEEREGQSAAAMNFWARAEGYAREAHWKNPGRDNIRRFLNRLDGEPVPQPTAAAAGDG
ncbi:MAG: hypothetical protein OES32_18570 [Acidobacteriota bacterium]|nr:hypothetical protein [Acidobacteriota bacterium]MDH3525581.1 hypothetical protein [Acidobacteriota bacterium]